MKKILVLHTSTFMGGAEYSLLELLRHWGNAQISLHIVCSSNQVLFRHINLLPVHVHDIYLPYLHRKHLFKTWMKIMKASVKLYQLVRKEKIQTTYCNTFRSLPFCFLVKWLCKPKIVCHCRDRIPSRFLHFMIRIIADECIVVSNAIQKELPRSSKTHIIHNGVNPLLFQKGDTSNFLIDQYRLSEHTRIIGNIGQIISWKNQIDYLAVAANLLRNHQKLHFFLVGAIVDKDYFCVLKQQILFWELEPYITFTGHVENIADYLSSFTVVLHTAHNEPFGRVLIEAAASAKPVVAYSSGGPSEIIENGKTGFLVADGDIETMAKTATMLLDNPYLQTIMGQSARKHVAQHFNSINYARKVYQILNQD